MEKIKLSQLVKIISREHAEGRNLNTRVYDSRTSKKYDRRQEKRRMQQESYRNKEYMRNNQKKYI